MVSGGEASAQRITVDGRLSPAQTLAGPNYTIGPELGRQVGGNLFHSFGAFGLNQGETATFTGPPSVGNVIGRVTGGASSFINGGVNSAITGANVYLINPAGMVLGPNATVNVSGSFHAGTADYLRLKDGARFQATNPDASTLTAAPPEAFGFLSANPQSVTVNGSALTLTPNQTLGLAGGAVTISNAALAVPGGTVHIASAAGPGEVPVDPRAGPPPTVTRFGQVQVKNSTILVDAGSGNVILGNGQPVVAAGGGSGSVFIRAGDLAITASDIRADNSGPGAAGVLSLQGDRVVTITTGSTIMASANGSGPGPAIAIATAPGGAMTIDSASVTSIASAAGAGGAISLAAGALTLRNGASASSQASDRGDGGSITVAADSTLLTGAKTSVGSFTLAAGPANAGGVPPAAGSGGNIVLTGGRLTIQDGAMISAATFGSGAGGSISVAMTGNVAASTGGNILSSTDPASTSTGGQSGNAGSVAVSAAGVSLSAGGAIRSATYTAGNAGEVALNVAGALTIDATGDTGAFVNGVSSETGDGSSGSAGMVRVNAGSVSVRNGGFINSNSNAGGTGAGGSVMVTTGSLLLDGLGDRNTEIGASAVGEHSGNAGTVTVSAGSATVRNGAQINSSTHSASLAGDVTVSAGALSLLAGGSIRSATFASGNAGQVALNVGGALTIDATGDNGGFVNGVSSEAAIGSSGSAGTVRVTAGSISVLNGGFINSNANGTGAGGSVAVTARGALLLDAFGYGGNITEIGASAVDQHSGNAGTVTVNADSVTVRGGARIASSTFSPGQGGGVTVNAGAVTVSGDGQIISGTSSAGNAGEVTLQVRGSLTVDGANSGDALTGVSSEAASGSSGNAGTVTINAGNVVVQGGAQVTSSTYGRGQGGDVTVKADALRLLRGGSISSATFESGNAGQVVLNVAGALTVDATDFGGFVNGVSSEAARGSSGAAGSIQVNAGSIAVLNGGFINSNTNATGVGGSVAVTAKGALLIDGQGNPNTEVGASALGARSAHAGTVTVSAGSVAVLNGGIIDSNTTAPGAGGSVTVTTPGALLLDGHGIASTQIGASATGARSGAAGTITIDAGDVTVQDGAQITSSTAGRSLGGDVTIRAGTLSLLRGGSISSATRASGNAGQVGLTVAGSLTIDATGDTGRFNNGVSSEAANGSSGSAGSVQVNAGSVAVLNGGFINSNTRGTGAGGSVRVTAQDALLLDGRGDPGTEIGASALFRRAGNAGTVTVSAGHVTIQNGGRISSITTGAGNGGNVDVTAGSDILLSGPQPQVTATSTGSGNAGSVTVAAPRVTLRDRASISTAAQTANGGNITIGPGDLLYLQDSSITTSVNGALGNGGNITVDPRFVVLNRSLIEANAVGGNGGNVLIRAGAFIQSPDSAVTATSQRGVSGEIFITGPLLDLNSALVVLASDLRSTAALLREGCAARGAGPRSSLVVAGRGGQRQGLEATLPALYFAHRPVRDGAGPTVAAAPVRTSVGVSARCG